MVTKILLGTAIAVVLASAGCGGKSSNDFNNDGTNPANVPPSGTLVVGTGTGSTGGTVTSADGGPSTAVPGYTGGVTQELRGRWLHHHKRHRLRPLPSRPAL